MNLYLYKHPQYGVFDTYDKLTMAYHQLIYQGISFTISIKHYCTEIFVVYTV